ncbi:hypothetical protein EW095_18065 [Vibrio cholerae]|nr:hypothetical protein [Vibrio cholerae]EGR0786710.1 hypothetical protein [Vibrio cholerae]EGR0836817.1 hypothetical protein [Vibrio cholerae]EGR0845266.1 hypothetical protein [Vibrio cholerae]EGR0862617.1 hypothetical protein [Vibrio cholerae]
MFLKAHNARLRGWQRINTKLKHNSRNHRGSMGLETPRVGSPFEAFVRHRMPAVAPIFPIFHCRYQPQNQ